MDWAPVGTYGPAHAGITSAPPSDGGGRLELRRAITHGSRGGDVAMSLSREAPVMLAAFMAMCEISAGDT